MPARTRSRQVSGWAAKAVSDPNYPPDLAGCACRIRGYGDGKVAYGVGRYDLAAIAASEHETRARQEPAVSKGQSRPWRVTVWDPATMAGSRSRAVHRGEFAPVRGGSARLPSSGQRQGCGWNREHPAARFIDHRVGQRVGDTVRRTDPLTVVRPRPRKVRAKGHEIFERDTGGSGREAIILRSCEPCRRQGGSGLSE